MLNIILKPFIVKKCCPNEDKLLIKITLKIRNLLKILKTA